MKVQKGWKDAEHTIPNYVYINKIDVIYSNDNSIFKQIKDVGIKKNPVGYWMFKDNKKNSYIINSNCVCWLNDEPTVMYVNAGVGE